MAEPQITPHRITKPIQLLAAWLAGLAIINASFLTAAATVHTPPWAPGLLVIGAVVNVPLFLISLFLLQTKYRPQMQEDSYYSKYLERAYSDKPAPASPIDVQRPLQELAGKIVAELARTPTGGEPANEEKVVKLLKDSEVDYLAERFAGSRALSELHMFPNLWTELVRSYGEDDHFHRDLNALVDAGLIVFPEKKPERAKLSTIGETVARKLEADRKLWNQGHKRHIPVGDMARA